MASEGGAKHTRAETCPSREAAPIGHLAGDGTATRATAAVFHALAHPIRLRIVGTLLWRGPATRSEMGAMLGRDPSVLEHHLATLRAAGLVTALPGPARVRYQAVDGLRNDLAILCDAEPEPDEPKPDPTTV